MTNLEEETKNQESSPTPSKRNLERNNNQLKNHLDMCREKEDRPESSILTTLMKNTMIRKALNTPLKDKGTTMIETAPNMGPKCALILILQKPQFMTSRKIDTQKESQIRKTTSIKSRGR